MYPYYQTENIKYYTLYIFVVVYGLCDSCFHFEHFGKNIFMRSFGFDDSWDVLLMGPFKFPYDT